MHVVRAACRRTAIEQNFGFRARSTLQDLTVVTRPLEASV